MTRFKYSIHIVFAVVFLVLLLLSTANYYLDLGFFGRGAKGVMLVVLGLFVVYAAYFVPSRADVQAHRDAQSGAKK